jgi:hypothetical protein
MRTNVRLLVSGALFSAVMLPGCSRGEEKPAPAPVVATPVPPSAEPAAAASEAAPKWADLKEVDFAGRTRVLAGLAWIEQAADQRIADFNTRRAAMKNDPAVWDAAMRVAMSDRSYLRSMATELAAATTEHWIEQKEKVGRALDTLNASFDKVSASIIP